jgi:hypothetical protein
MTVNSNFRPTRSIGLVDYCLDNFHARVYLEALRGPLSSRGFTIAGATAMQRASSFRWCQEHDVPYLETVDALNEQVQYFMVLAPSNPEVHFELCQRVFPFGKATFVDKTFAPDYPTAGKIFELADRHGVAVQTTSALRTTNVHAAALALGEPLRHMAVSAGGTTWEEYGIHPVELVISCMGPGVEAVMQLGNEILRVLVLGFRDRRTAVITFHVGVHVPFSAQLVTPTTATHVVVNDEKLFVDAAASILDFFEAGQAQIDRAESLIVRRILDVTAGTAPHGQFVSLE